MPSQLPLVLQETDSHTEARTVASPTSRPAPLLERLRERLDIPIDEVVLTQNRSTILSAIPPTNGDTGWTVRIHEGFADASDPVIQAVADYLGRNGPASCRRRALAVLRAQFERRGQGATTRAAAPPQDELVSRGEHHDLLELLRQVTRRPTFARAATPEVRISWGAWPRLPRRRRRLQRSLQLGSYVREARLIRIHPVLDAEYVPELVVRSVIHHELLHAIVPPRRRGTTSWIHPPEFRRLERLDPERDAAELWLREGGLDRLLRRSSTRGRSR